MDVCIIYMYTRPWGVHIPSPVPNTVRVKRLIYVHIYVHIPIYVHICVYMYIYVLNVYIYCLEASVCHYGVATMSTHLKIIGLFCKRAL